MSAVVWPHRTSPLVGLEKTGRSYVPASAARATGEKRMIRIIMAGGGTGGHLYPGLAVAEALRERLGDSLELIWAATPRPVDQRLLGQYGPRYVAQPVQPLVRKISKLWPFWRGWQRSCGYWTREFAAKKPDAVLALGGYAAGPASYVASKLHTPLALLNPDALPGIANRFLLKRCDRVFTQWLLPTDLTAPIRGRVLAVGCPIRESLLGRGREDAAARLGLDPNKKTLVITGASLGAKTINDAIPRVLLDVEVAKAMASGWQVLHLTGLEQAQSVRDAYAPITKIPHKILDYCDDMASVWALADLAIARAGASTCAELTACGVPSLLLPYPYHKDMHQRHNAAQLVEAGAAILVEDQKDAAANAAHIKAAMLPLLYNEDQRVGMADQAHLAGKPHAAREIANQLIEMIELNHSETETRDTQ